MSPRYERIEESRETSWISRGRAFQAGEIARAKDLSPERAKRMVWLGAK